LRWLTPCRPLLRCRPNRIRAAIYGVRGKADIQIFMLFPKGRVSPIQEAQMTSVLDDNVHCISVEGTFDDCQVRSVGERPEDSDLGPQY
jgi:hypothetical protein